MSDGRHADIESLRQWLRTERRLGIPHWAVGADAAELIPGSARRVPYEPPAVPAPAAEAVRSVSAEERADAGPPSRVPAARGAVTLPLISEESDLPLICARELSEAQAARELARLDEGFVRGCRRCGLHASRTRTVFGVGRSRPEVVFVGEGPGVDEDREGEPFVGKAGQLLTRMIAAMTLTREQVYICNVVKCRPPENRTPLEEEMRACAPFLFRQLAILRPRVIVALGRPAAQTLLATSQPIGQLRGEFHEFPPLAYHHLGLPPAPVMPTFHPAYLLRSPWEKGKAWEDLKQVMRLLKLPVPGE